MDQRCRSLLGEAELKAAGGDIYRNEKQMTALFLPGLIMLDLEEIFIGRKELQPKGINM